MQPDKLEEAVDTALDGEPRATRWREMRAALAARLRALKQERDDALARGDAGTDVASLTRQINAAQQQIEVLRTEEAVAQFTEETVRRAAARVTLSEDDQ